MINILYTTEYLNFKNCHNLRYKNIFLAGPCYRNRHTNWRKRFASLLNIDCNLFIPEFRNYKNKKYNEIPFEQIYKWEDWYLRTSDAIVFWVNRTDKLPGLTTNVEFGKYYKYHSVIYGRPKNAKNIRYLDIMYKETYKPIFNSLTGIANYINRKFGDKI